MTNLGVNRNKSFEGCVSKALAKRKSSRAVHVSRAGLLRKGGNSHFKILCNLSLFISCRLQLPEHDARYLGSKGLTCIKITLHSGKNLGKLPARGWPAASCE